MSAALGKLLGLSLAKRSGKLIGGGLTLATVTAATGGGELPRSVAHLLEPRPMVVDQTSQIKAVESQLQQIQATDPKQSLEQILSQNPRLAALLLGGGAAAAAGVGVGLAVRAARRRRKARPRRAPRRRGLRRRRRARTRRRR